MNNFTIRFAEYYDLAKIKYVVVNDVIWYVYQKTVIPLGPVKFGYTLHKEEISFLLSKFHNSFLLKYTDGFDTNNQRKCKEWYSIIKDRHDDLDTLTSERRSEIRRGLKNCLVERIDADFLSSHGYEIYLSAIQRYNGTKRNSLTEENFKKLIIERKFFPDIFHYWGVFYDSKFIGYSENLVYGNTESNYSTIKLSPQYLVYYPSYALIHKMNEYYLKECKFNYVNDGFRSLLHQSNIQNFLIKKFNFFKKYTNLQVHYKPIVAFAVVAAFPIKEIFKQRYPQIDALLKLEEIRRKCESFNK